MIKGINIANPIEADKEYLLYAVEYAAQNGFDHIQINGPIHDIVKANIDGMTPLRKYAQFKDEQDTGYIERALDSINAACSLAHNYSIKVYMWHHELELPSAFAEAFPETKNESGDIEVTHPIVRDYIENKLLDFFAAYPYMDGIILTLHETKIPLLKLKDQKLGKTERVKYVTKLLYDTLKSMGKELIVRPFASIAEDYEMMAQAYEEISHDLIIMDKWTQFDWSLTLPHNDFFSRIKKNPLLVEADIFGEFFGKGRLPLMLSEHLAQKFSYCKEFYPRGYVLRIDREGQNFFGDVNEVNFVISSAYMSGSEPNSAVQAFFDKRYPGASKEVMHLMQQTEDVIKKTIYLGGYYFTELSIFPTLNHCKNHYYFQIMSGDGRVDANEWYIPRQWKCPSKEEILSEKDEAVNSAKALCEALEKLADRIDNEEYIKLHTKFLNLVYVTEVWRELTKSILYYEQYIDSDDSNVLQSFNAATDELLRIDREGRAVMGDSFYCAIGLFGIKAPYIENFVQDIRQSLQLEKAEINRFRQKDNITDFIICGAGAEKHNLSKEVNFSDTLIYNNSLCRIAGNRMGSEWSSIKAHGWFSYNVCVREGETNNIHIVAGGRECDLKVAVFVNNERYVLDAQNNEKKEYVFVYNASLNTTEVTIRFDKIADNVPCIYEIWVD